MTIKTSRTGAMTYTLSASKLDPTKKYDLWNTGTDPDTLLTDANTPLQPTTRGTIRTTGSFTGSVEGATFELRQRQVELTLEVIPTTVYVNEKWAWTITLKGWDPAKGSYEPLAGERVEAYQIGSEGYFGAGTTDAVGQVKGTNIHILVETVKLHAIYLGKGVYLPGESDEVKLIVEAAPKIEPYFHGSLRSITTYVDADTGIEYVDTMFAAGTLQESETGPGIGGETIQIYFVNVNNEGNLDPIEGATATTDFGPSGYWETDTFSVKGLKLLPTDVYLGNVIFAGFAGDATWDATQAGLQRS